MSKRASPVVVGTFVITGFVLALIAVAILGGGKMFRETATMIAYFDGSVDGLRLGAPVKFRGIDIGTVKDVRLNMTGALRDPAHVRIPVVIEIDLGRVSAEGVRAIDLRDRAQVRVLVDRGLRAELATESLVTGLRFVALDIKPGTPAVMMSDPLVDYPEIPSIRGPMDQAPEKLNDILTKVARLDLDKVLDSVDSATKSIQKTAESFTATANDAHRLLGSRHATQSVANVDELTAKLNHTVAELDATVREIRPVLLTARKLVSPDGAINTQLSATMKEMASAATSLRRLSDQLARDPGALLRGGRQ